MATGYKGNRGSSRRGSGSAAKRRGQVRSGKKVQYSIKNSRGDTKYIGTTNNPSRRAVEHSKAGKLGPRDRLVVETRAIPQKSAENVESAKLASFRKRYGRNPRHNSTNDGRWHP